MSKKIYQMLDMTRELRNQNSKLNLSSKDGEEAKYEDYGVDLYEDPGEGGGWYEAEYEVRGLASSLPPSLAGAALAAFSSLAGDTVDRFILPEEADRLGQVVDRINQEGQGPAIHTNTLSHLLHRHIEWGKEEEMEDEEGSKELEEGMEHVQKVSEGAEHKIDNLHGDTENAGSGSVKVEGENGGADSSEEEGEGEAVVEEGNALVEGRVEAA